MNASRPPPPAALPETAEEVPPPVQPRLLDIPALAVFALLFLTVALQFFTRYVLNDSFGWTEEIARYFLILLGFSGGILCVRNNSHIALEFIFHHLPPALARPLMGFCRLTVGGFFLYCGWLAIELAQRTGSNMASIEVPKAVIYYLVSAACFAMALLAFAGLRRLAETVSEHSRINL